jgi:hypothetical protein
MHTHEVKNAVGYKNASANTAGDIVVKLFSQNSSKVSEIS